MSETRIVLLRHATTASPEVCQGARHDVELSETGRRQATAALDRVGPVDRCVVSPLGRARATLAVEPRLAATAVVDPAWRERDFGTWEGRPWTAVVDEVPAHARQDTTSYLAYTPDGGEAWTGVATRVGQALDRLADHGGTTLVVTHGGPVRLAVAHVLGVGLERVLALRPAYATSTWLTRVDGVWQLDRFGW